MDEEYKDRFEAMINLVNFLINYHLDDLVDEMTKKDLIKNRHIMNFGPLRDNQGDKLG